MGRKIDWKSVNPSAQDTVTRLGDSGGAGVMLFHAQEQRQLRHLNFRGPGGYGMDPAVMTEFSVHPQLNLFSIVSQISPSGTAMLEDLPLLDPSDPEQWLVAVSEQQGDDIIVHRHLYCAEER